MANFINKYQNQSAYEADSTKQYPNVSLVNGTVEYAATAPSYVFTTSSQTTQNINSDTTTVTLSVTSTKNGNAIGYTGSTNDAWITNIASNNGTVTVTIATNSGSSRNGTVVLTQNESGNTLTFTIAQAAPSYVFTTSSQTTQNVASDTTTVTLSVTSTKNGSAIGYTGSTNDSWISNISISGGTATLTLSTNSGSARNGSVTLTQNESGNTLSFTIAQAAPIVDDSNVTYVVNAPSAMTTKIFGYDDEGSVSNPSTFVDYIKVDGESVNLTTLYSNDNDYQLTQGQHTIKYKFKETSNTYEINGMLGVFRDTNHISIATSIVCEEGLGAIYGNCAQLEATTVDLPNSLNGIFMVDTIGVGCTNLYLRKTGATPELATNCIETVCVDCTEYDPEDPDTCIDCAEEECTSSEDVYPVYTNLYVPSESVETYTIAGWSNVSAIS